MPDWWFEATLPAVVFGALLIVWVIVPPRPGESDFGSRVRGWVARRGDRPPRGS